MLHCLLLYVQVWHSSTRNQGQPVGLSPPQSGGPSVHLRSVLPAGELSSSSWERCANQAAVVKAQSCALNPFLCVLSNTIMQDRLYPSLKAFKTIFMPHCSLLLPWQHLSWGVTALNSLAASLAPSAPYLPWNVTPRWTWGCRHFTNTHQSPRICHVCPRAELCPLLIVSHLSAI